MADYTFIFQYFDTRLRSKKKSLKSFRILTTKAARDYTTLLLCLLSHVKHYFMVRLPKQNRLRAHILRVKFLDLNIHATLDQTLRASCTSFTSRLNDCGLFHVLIYRVCIAARVASVKEHSLLSSGTKRKKIQREYKRETASRFRSDDGLNTKSSRAIREGRFDF